MNPTIKSQSLSSEAALALWNEVRNEVIKAIVGTLRTMGLPTVAGRGARPIPSGVGGRTPSPQAVRLALVRDRELHDDILDEVVRQYWAAVYNGKVGGEADKPLIFCIVQRTTWKRGTRRARELLNTLEPVGTSDVLTSVPSDASPVDEVVDRKAVLERLRRTLKRLSPEEQALIQAKVEGSYDSLDLPGLEKSSVRARACRLWKRVVEEILEGGG